MSTRIPRTWANAFESPFRRARYALALNPAAAPETLQALANDGNCFVRAAAQHSLNQRLAKEKR
jgi:hypothetical protein